MHLFLKCPPCFSPCAFFFSLLAAFQGTVAHRWSIRLFCFAQNVTHQGSPCWVVFLMHAVNCTRFPRSLLLVSCKGKSSLFSSSWLCACRIMPCRTYVLLQKVAERNPWHGWSKKYFWKLCFLVESMYSQWETSWVPFGQAKEQISWKNKALGLDFTALLIAEG